MGRTFNLTQSFSGISTQRGGVVALPTPSPNNAGTPGSFDVGIFRGELVAVDAMGFAGILGADALPTQKVFSDGYDLDVGGVDAFTHSAQMVTLFLQVIAAKNAHKKLIGKPVGGVGNSLVAGAENAIAANINSTGPFPATSGFINEDVREEVSEDYAVNGKFDSINASHIVSYSDDVIRLGGAFIAPLRAVSIISRESH